MTAPAERFDVAVVGGGPAGALAARTARSRGLRVVVLERDRRPRGKLCGEYLCPGAVTELHAAGLGPALERCHTAPLEGMRLFSPSGREVRTRFPRGAAGLSVRRDDFDARLLEECGAEVRRGARMTDLAVTPDGVELHLEDGRPLHAQVVVGADGRNSVVARRLGLRLPARQKDRVSLHAYVADVAGCEPAGEMHFAGDGGYVGLNPGWDGLVNVNYVCDLDRVARHGLARTRAVLEEALDALPSLRARFSGARIAGPVRLLAPLEVRATRPHDTRVLLAGDAAGFLDPLTGEGMFGAIVSGRLAGAWAARAVESGRADRRALAGYARDRRRAFGSKLLLNRMFQGLLRRPGLLEPLARRLGARRRLGDTLIGVIGNTLPPSALLRPRSLAALLAPGGAA